jgi:predicted amidophosphoribosyltransferase
MAFCHKCGKKISEDDLFCSNCGARTKKGIEAGVSAPAEEMREAFSKMGQEMEKAFAVAAKEIHEAFKTARENIRQSTGRETVVCSHCGEKNASGASYCYKCGEKIGTE